MIGVSATGRRGSSASCPEPRTQQGLLFPFAEGAGLLSARLKCTAAPPPWTSIHPFNKVIHSAVCVEHLPCARLGHGGLKAVRWPAALCGLAAGARTWQQQARSCGCWRGCWRGCWHGGGWRVGAPRLARDGWGAFPTDGRGDWGVSSRGGGEAGRRDGV